MTIATLFLLALGVSADAFAVAVAHGASTKRLARSEAFRIAIAFGSFQAIMPAIGWFIGRQFEHLIVSYDHWLAFIFLIAIGGKMIYDDFGSDEMPSGEGAAAGYWHLLALAVATSIDALAVGVGLLFLPSITFAALSIGFVTFALSLLGVFLGHRFKALARSKSKAIGGMILILIGTKILFEHLGYI